MKVVLAFVGRPGRLLAPAIAEFEERAGRYWSLQVEEVREEAARKGTADDDVRAAETARLLDRVPDGFDVFGMTRAGKGWSSREYARRLNDIALHGRPGAAFLVGGALGLHTDAVRARGQLVSLGPATLPHELARLVLVEQIYRAGTIVRGEPYHKG